MRVQLEPAGLDLREVEDVVDDRQERLARRVDGLGVVALLGVERRVEQQPAHPDDGVHRGPDLVAHRGQERALGLVRRVRVAARGVELGDVVVDRVVAELLAVDDQRHDQDLGVDDRAVLAHPLADLVGAALARATRVRSWPGSRGVPSRRTRSSMFRPMASSGSNPNRVVAAGFQPDTRSSESIVTIATGLTATSDSKYDFCRSSSAVRSWTRRSRVATFARSSRGHLVERHRERADLVLGLDPGHGFEVARGHLGRRGGQLQDRPGDPSGHEPDPAGEQDGRDEPDQPDDQGQLARRSRRPRPG